MRTSCWGLLWASCRVLSLCVAAPLSPGLRERQAEIGELPGRATVDHDHVVAAFDTLVQFINVDPGIGSSGSCGDCNAETKKVSSYRHAAHRALKGWRIALVASRISIGSKIRW